MLKLLADENVNGRILRGLRSQYPQINLLRIQDTPLIHASDPAILEYAVVHQRVILTHDKETMVGYAYERLKNKQPMAGLILLPANIAIGLAIEEIALVSLGYTMPEIHSQVVYLPL